MQRHLDDPTHPYAQAVAVNRSLADNAAAHKLSESFLIERFEALMAYPPANGELFWLTLARITEMALFCAGNYADSGEIQAAGSLLVNPRQVLVHIQDRPDPVLKKRNQSLSRQFRHLAGSCQDVRQWLRENTRLEVVQPPFLPQLMGFMTNGARFRNEYQDSVKDRACRVADTINLVSSCQMEQDMDFSCYLAVCRPEDRTFLEAGLCRFDLRLFWELGEEVHTVLATNMSNGRFVAKHPKPQAGYQDILAMEATAFAARSIS